MPLSCCTLVLAAHGRSMHGASLAPTAQVQLLPCSSSLSGNALCLHETAKTRSPKSSTLSSRGRGDNGVTVDHVLAMQTATTARRDRPHGTYDTILRVSPGPLLSLASLLSHGCAAVGACAAVHEHPRRS